MKYCCVARNPDRNTLQRSIVIADQLSRAPHLLSRSAPRRRLFDDGTTSRARPLTLARAKYTGHSLEARILKRGKSSARFQMAKIFTKKMSRGSSFFFFLTDPEMQSPIQIRSLRCHHRTRVQAALLATASRIRFKASSASSSPSEWKWSWSVQWLRIPSSGRGEMTRWIDSCASLVLCLVPSGPSPLRVWQWEGPPWNASGEGKGAVLSSGPGAGTS